VPTICLIIPPSVFLLDERVFMMLGILRVAAVLEKAGWQVEVLDLSGIENYEEVARLHAGATPAEIFGITATTPHLPAARRIIEEIRAARPAARVILGGPHVTLVNAAAKGERKRGRVGRAQTALAGLEAMADILVAGDGEEAIFQAVDPSKSASPIDADDPVSPLFLNSSRLNELPFPARHLVDVQSYHYTIEGERALSMIAQLGCPFSCGFCGGRESPSLRRVRMRTADNVVAEMVNLQQAYGVRGFMLYDDELNVNPRMMELMDKIRRAQDHLQVEFRLRGFIKAELFTEEQAAAMYRAGFRWILVGFESGAPQILENINKNATQDDNTRCLKIARDHGLKVKALMSIGHPGESADTIAETRDWLLRVQPDDFDVSIITTYPGTPYYDHAVPHTDRSGIWVYTCAKTGDRLYTHDLDYTVVADYYKGDPDGGYHAFLYTDYLSADALVELRDRLERDIRARLGIPFNPAAPAIRYEHSMGQSGPLSPEILRSTHGAAGLSPGLCSTAGPATARESSPGTREIR